MKPNDLSPEELEIWNNSPWRESGKIRTILALRAIKEMQKQPVTLERMKAQVVAIFKRCERPLTPEEAVIWNNTIITEHQRVLRIHAIRAKKKRAEYLLLKHQRPISPVPHSPPVYETKR